MMSCLIFRKYVVDILQFEVHWIISKWILIYVAMLHSSEMCGGRAANSKYLLLHLLYFLKLKYSFFLQLPYEEKTKG